MERTKYLPIEIVEQIIARMPYPSIFKCRCLSKSWLARFASISSETNEVKKRRAISFQKQVGESSNSWKTLCPVFATDNRDFIAYDRISHKWRRLPSLPLPDGTLCGKSEEKMQIEGALVYVFYRNSIESKKYVANILTGAWKQLPACPNMDVSVLMEKLVSCASSEFYEVILLCVCRRRGSDYDIGQHELHVQIYDSKLDAWSTKKVVFSCDLKTYNFGNEYTSNTLYLNGNLYSGDFQINFAEGTLEKLDMQSPVHSYCTTRIMMAGWNGHVLIVTEDNHHESYLLPGIGFNVLKFDFQSEQLSELARCSFPVLEINDFDVNLEPVFDGHCIFFGVEADGTRILTLDIDKNEWGCFCIPALTSYHEWKYKWVGSTFQPGLNPFATV